MVGRRIVEWGSSGRMARVELSEGTGSTAPANLLAHRKTPARVRFEAGKRQPHYLSSQHTELPTLTLMARRTEGGAQKDEV